MEPCIKFKGDGYFKNNKYKTDSRFEKEAEKIEVNKL